MDANIWAVVARYTFGMAYLLKIISGSLDALETQRVIDFEEDTERANMLHFKPPSVSLVKTLMAPQQAVLRSERIGMNNVPKKDTPALYVMNHFLYSLEMLSFEGGVYLKQNIYVRGLANPLQLCSPYGSILKVFKEVDGTPAHRKER
jgi:hypothetical protein